MTCEFVESPAYFSEDKETGKETGKKTYWKAQMCVTCRVSHFVREEITEEEYRKIYEKEE